MSELKVNSIESNNTLTANSVVVGNVSINSIGITAPTHVVNTSAIAIGNSSANITITANSSVNFVVVDNVTNVFPEPLDIYAWASLASSFNNCTVSRDTTIPASPAGGIPFKIDPSGSDPHPSTYNANTWNLASTANNDIWKLSGYVRANGSITLSPSEFLLLLPANSSGNYGTAGEANTNPSVTLTSDTWTYFETIFQINGNANTRYIQIRPDGPNAGLNDFWYDGLSLQKVVSNTLITETVNTQIFTADGTWTKPSWATDGKELVIVHMWGGGGGGGVSVAGSGGGGGAFVFGYFIAGNLGSTQAVTVGLGGAQTATFVSAADGANSIFAGLTAYGGQGMYSSGAGGGGGGWFSRDTTENQEGGAPLGGANTAGSSPDSTFGGGYGAGNVTRSGQSIYGGGGGGCSSFFSGANSVYGGGGGMGVTGTNGKSIFGGDGGTRTVAASAPGGGGGSNTTSIGSGARGEVRVYTLRIMS
jgi:hypothetical protein